MKKIFLIILSITLLFACKHELESPTWDVDVILPIAHAKLNINNIISDTAAIINEDDEGFISLVFQQEFIDMNLDTLIKIDAIADEQTHTLDSATFTDVVVSNTITVQDILGIDPNGASIPILAQPNIVTNDTAYIDASEYFETMKLHKGWLIVEISNNLPTNISNVEIELKDINLQNIINDPIEFLEIQSGTTVTDSFDISGETINKDLIAIIKNIDLDASNGLVPVYGTDAVITNIIISDIGITEATAIFPEQQLTETLKEHTFDFGDAQITEIGIKSGTVKINVLSTLPNGKMIYNIPSLKKNGVSFTTLDFNEMIIPQATNTDLTAFNFDFEGYILDLSGKEGRLGGDTVNTIYTDSYTFIDSTGALETINATDSFHSFVEFDFMPEYAKGYIGADTFEFASEVIETDIFNLIESGSIDIESANIKIGIDNYIGANAAVQINQLSVLNDNTEVEAIFDNTEIYSIERAKINGNNIIDIEETYTEINIDANEMLEIFPNKIKTSATFYLNPGGQSANEDFLFPAKPIEANVGVEIPLKFIANELTLSNTSDVSIENIEEIEILYISIENGLPLEATLNLITLDEANQVIDTLLVNKQILSALTNDEGRVTESTLSTLEIKNSDFSNIKNIKAVSSFTTKPQDKHISIYSTYEMDITLSAKFKKTLGN